MTDPEPTLLDITQADMAAVLSASEVFPVGVVVLAIEPKDINSRVNEALAKLGLAVFVMPPEPLECTDVGGETIIFFPRVLMKVRVVQNVTLSMIPMTARAARNEVMKLGQGLPLPHTGVENNRLGLARKPQDKAEFPGEIIYDVNFEFASHLR